MLHTILIAGALVAVTVAIHAVGLGIVLSRWAKVHPVAPTRFWPITWLLIRLAWCLILIHLVEISVWGLFYLWRGCMPNAGAAFYFSGVTYTTLGYGDLVLPPPWRRHIMARPRQPTMELDDRLLPTSLCLTFTVFYHLKPRLWHLQVWRLRVF